MWVSASCFIRTLVAVGSLYTFLKQQCNLKRFKFESAKPLWFPLSSIVDSSVRCSLCVCETSPLWGLHPEIRIYQKNNYLKPSIRIQCSICLKMYDLNKVLQMLLCIRFCWIAMASSSLTPNVGSMIVKHSSFSVNNLCDLMQF